MNNPVKDQSRLYYRKKIAAIMGGCLTIGIVFGAALGNIALGLAIGIIIGGIGVIWYRKE